MDPVDFRNVTIIDLKSSQIDKENSIIRRVAIMSHLAYNADGEVFREFTDRAMNDAVEIFEGSLARIDHDRDNASAQESRGVKSGYGVYKDIKREGNKIFGDLYLWECDDARKVMSIAARTPNDVGNSIHTGAVVEENDKGIEVVQRLLPRTPYGFKPSIDLVDDPAATVSIYQNKTVKPKPKETVMEWKDVTLEGIKTNRTDLFESIKAEGSASRDDEVKELKQEKEDTSKKLDDLQVKQSKSKQEVLVSQLLNESKLPDYAKTDLFQNQLVNVTETKDGDKTTSAEDGIKALIQDRIDALEPSGVRGNTEKDIHQKRKGGDKVDDEEFVEVFGQGTDIP